MNGQQEMLTLPRHPIPSLLFRARSVLHLYVALWIVEMVGGLLLTFFLLNLKAHYGAPVLVWVTFKIYIIF